MSNANSIICPLLGFSIVQHAAVRKPDIVLVPPHSPAGLKLTLCYTWSFSCFLTCALHAEGLVKHCWIKSDTSSCVHVWAMLSCAHFINAMLCYAVLCCAVLCWAVLCCAVLCYAFMLCFNATCNARKINTIAPADACRQQSLELT